MTANVRVCRRLAVGCVAGLVAVSVGLAAGAPAGAASKPKPRKPKRQAISQLYALNAAHGTLGHGAHGYLVLRLRGLERQAVWFADRPTRASRSFPSSAFASAWKGFGFAADPPDAALEYTHAGRQRTAMLELSHPRYAKHHRVLSFRARLLDPHKVKDPNLASHARAADRKPAHHFAAASLFVAEDSAPVINGCTIQAYTQCPGADLSGADLSFAILTDANLNGANLTDAELTFANLIDASLTDAYLTDAYLNDASLTNANLTDADLTDAYLNDANLVDANLNGANLNGAFLIGADLSNATLTGALFCNTIMPDGSFNTSGCQ